MSIVARYPMNGNANNTVVGGYLTISASGTVLNGSSYSAVGQSFSGYNNGTANSVTVSIRKVNSPTGTLRARLITNPSVPGTYIAQSTNTVSITGLTTSYANYTFTFSGETITSDPIYLYIFPETGGGDAANRVEYDSGTGTTYSGGTAYAWLGTTPTPLGADLKMTADFLYVLNGTASNVTWVDGNEGQAASFSGVSTSCIIIPSAFYDLIKTRNDYWFDFWIYSGTTVNQIPLSYAGAADFYFYISSAGKITLRRGTNFTAESGNSFEFNKWQKFTIQYTSETNANLYKNGKLVQAFTVSATPNTTTNFYIGRYFDTTFPFTGKVDRFQVGTGNLSVAEIKNDYLLTAGYYGQ